MSKNAKPKAKERKRRKRMQADMARTQQSLNQSGQLDANLEVPNDFDNCIIQPTNSLIKLTGSEPRVVLKNGQLLVKCDKFAIIPLKEYDQLLEAYQAMARAAGAAQARKQALQSPRIIMPTQAQAQAAVAMNAAARALKEKDKPQ